MAPYRKTRDMNSRHLTLIIAIGLILAALALFLVNAATPPVVTVEWSTASELNTAGFNVSRGDSQTGPFTRLNAEVIPASPDPLVGGSYLYTDTQVVAGQTYYYQLEEVESGGSTNVQGVVTVTASGGLSPLLIGAGIVVALGFFIVVIWLGRKS
jgi:hypothetical protein